MAKLLASVLEFLNHIFRILFIAFLVVLVTLLSLIILPPLYLMRLGVSLVAKHTRPDLGPMLEARSTFMGLDIYRNPNPTVKIQSTFILEGDLDKAKFTKQLQTAIQIKRSKGSLKNHQLTEYLVSYMGFFFWKPENNFDLNEHVILSSFNEHRNQLNHTTNPEECHEISYEQLQTIEKLLLHTPFGHERSPWDFHIVPNVRPKFAKEEQKYTALLVRNHHCLADGYSIIKFLFNDLAQNDKNLLVLPKFPKLGYAQQVCMTLYSTIRVPFDIVNGFLAKPDVNPWHPPAEKLYGNSNFYMVESDPVPVEYLKDIKRKTGAPIAAIVQASITGAIREMMTMKNLEVPDLMTSMIPFPYPGHPNKLGNYWSAALIPFPVGVPDSNSRLQYIQNAISQLRHSTAALTMFKVQLIFGALFYKIVKPVAQFRIPTIIVSDFPGPTKEAYLMGQKCVDGHFIAGFPPGNTGLVFFSSSYNASWKMKIMVDHGILQSQQDVEIMMDKVMNELKKLHGPLEV